MHLRVLIIKLVLILLIFSLGLSLSGCSVQPEERSVTNPFPNRSEGSYSELLNLAPISESEIVAHSLRIDIYDASKIVSRGSGICLGANIGITNWHVVQKPVLNEQFYAVAVTQDGRQSRVISVALDFAYFDVAVLRFSDDLCPGGVPVKDPKASPSRSPILNVSSPASGSFQSFEGFLDSPHSQTLGSTVFRSYSFNWVPYETQILTSSDLALAGVGNGSSGSAVFQDGRMIGVVFAKGGQENRIFIVDSSFLTLKPFAELEWFDFGSDELDQRMNQSVNLSPNDEIKIPLPQSFTIRAVADQSQVASHSIGAHWSLIDSIVHMPNGVLTYGNGKNAVLCLLRSSKSDQSSLVTLKLNMERGINSCRDLHPDEIVEEAVFFDTDNDGLAEKVSIGKANILF